MAPKFVPKTPEEIAAIAAKMRVSDPKVDNGAFSSIKKMDAFIWLKMLGVTDISNADIRSDDDEKARNKLRIALWDTQRIGNIFPGTTQLETDLKVDSLRTWTDWTKARPELNQRRIGTYKLDMLRDEARLKS